MRHMGVNKVRDLEECRVRSLTHGATIHRVGSHGADLAVFVRLRFNFVIVIGLLTIMKYEVGRIEVCIVQVK